MEDYIENIPDENIQIVSPIKCIFLLNKRNMFIKSEKISNNYKIYNRNNKEKEKSDISNDDPNLKTIIKEPGILTSNLIIDIRSIIKSKINDTNKNKVSNNFNKSKKNTKISLYKKVKNEEDINNKNNSLNDNKKLNNNINSKSKNTQNKPLNKIKINNKKIQNYNNSQLNMTHSPRIQNIDNNKIKDINYTNIKSNTSKKGLENKDLQKKNINNRIFVKKLSKEYKNKKNRNSLSIHKNKEKLKEREKQDQRIITKKIAIKPELLAKKKNIEEKNKLYMTQKDLISNLKVNNEIIINTDSSNSIINTKEKTFSKSNKNFLEEKNIYKSRIYHIDYYNNKKRDLTNIIIGLNIIKDITYKKLKNNFLKIRKICIYKRKIINNILMTPKLKKYNKEDIEINNSKQINKDKNYNSIEDTEIKNHVLNKNFYDSNIKLYQKESQYFDLYETKTNVNSYKMDNYINEFHKMIEKKTKTNYMNKNKKNSVLLLNPSSYINNCNINSIQINLFKNGYINDSKNNNKNKIIVKNITKTNIRKLTDYNKNIDIIKTSKTS